jgi:hypothetical protein
MPQAISPEKRAAIWQRRAAGEKQTEIAQTLGISVQTVGRILTRDPSDLVPRYAACGQRWSAGRSAQQAAVIALKRAHPRWGAEMIRLELAPSDTALPSARTLQRWFRQAGVHQRRERVPQPRTDKGVTVHAVWEVDAKEQVRLGDGSLASAMLAVDEASGALISALAFPPRGHQSGAADRGA